MSGVIPDSIITVSAPITPTGFTDPYRIVSFPTRVKVTAVSFTVNSIAAGAASDNRVFLLGCVKGRKAKDLTAPSGSEDIIPFFGDNEKPEVVCADNTFLSSIGTPIENGTWFGWGGSYVADVAQMDTDEYLTVWVFNDAGAFPEEFDWLETTATISIAYTGATNPD